VSALPSLLLLLTPPSPGCGSRLTAPDSSRELFVASKVAHSGDVCTCGSWRRRGNAPSSLR
jgi:hypothetical protein